MGNDKLIACETNISELYERANDYLEDIDYLKPEVDSGDLESIRRDLFQAVTALDNVMWILASARK